MNIRYDYSLYDIVFDLGGVLFSNGTSAFVRYLEEKYNVNAADARDLLNGELGSCYRCGNMSKQRFWESVLHNLSIEAISVDDFSTRWNEMYVINDSVIEIIEQLRAKGHNLYYLSDNIKERVEYLEAKYHFLYLFEDGIFSYEIHNRKPSLEMYTSLNRKTKHNGSHIIYIDDNSDFLKPAQELGWSTILFKSSMDLMTSLQAFGVL